MPAKGREGQAYHDNRREGEGDEEEPQHSLAGTTYSYK